MITPEQIIWFAPHCSMGWAVCLAGAMPKWGINTDTRVAMFLAQCAHESDGFTRFEENLNYSAEALMRTWPARFATIGFAAGYARQPDRIANYVYANRMGNGNEASGDGWRFRGRGPIQLTGRNGARGATDGVGFGFLAHPEELALPAHGADAACWYWKSHGLNELADQSMFAAITQRINGGQNGAASRELWLAQVSKAMTGPNGPMNA